ncbi:hypothetical protein SAY87_014677 [Trapa incisa]|uniref:Uncharacterized protein n=1 Tax=Trapa incisa TaxID=236973 RepID=A0AAN7GKD2_9MYRT|nr:hypothetical protein SAY87_014677 [Trapa incisa]
MDVNNQSHPPVKVQTPPSTAIKTFLWPLLGPSPIISLCDCHRVSRISLGEDRKENPFDPPSMKKLYRKGTVHPSSPAISDPLSFLPAAIFSLAAALSPEDREVLAYLLISSNSNGSDFNNSSGHATFYHRKSSFSSSPCASAGGGGQRSCLPSKGDHPPTFSCDCFSCYMSYWLRWDCSPKRELIHEIIDQIEDGVTKRGDGKVSGTGKTKKKERRKTMRGKGDSGQQPSPSEERYRNGDSRDSFSESAGLGTLEKSTDLTCSGEEVPEEGEEKGSLRRLVGFVGEKLWGIWN